MSSHTTLCRIYSNILVRLRAPVPKKFSSSVFLCLLFTCIEHEGCLDTVLPVIVYAPLYFSLAPDTIMPPTEPVFYRSFLSTFALIN